MPLHYVGIRVTNLSRSLRFYRRVLGLREVVRGDDRRSGRGIWVGLSDPRSGARLELNWYPAGSRYATRFSAGEALDHIGFHLGKVPRSRLDSEYRRLLRAGARPTRVTPETSDGWQACVLDPDGNWIEIFRTPTRSETVPQRAAGRRAPRRKPA